VTIGQWIDSNVAIVTDAPIKLGLRGMRQLLRGMPDVCGWGHGFDFHIHGTSLPLFGIELLDKLPEERGIHIDADAHEHEPVTISCVGEDLAHMRLGHSAQVGAQQLETIYWVQDTASEHELLKSLNLLSSKWYLHVKTIL